MEQTTEQTVLDIKPYIFKKSAINGFDFYYYLHIRGGSGIDILRKTRLGGEYNFILFYAAPEDMEDLKGCERKWCEKMGIIFGEGNTIEEAYQDYLNKTK